MKINKDILSIIKCGVLTDNGNEYFLPDMKLERKDYVKTNEILESMGFKWNRRSKSHINSEDVSDKFYNMIDSGEWVDIKKEYQFFPTPKEIVSQMIDMVDWDNVETCLEPSFGTGNILKEFPLMTGIKVYGCELNPEMFKNTIVDIGNLEDVELYNIDFLNFNKKVDVIIANPPFTKLQSIKHFNHMVNLLNTNGQLVCIVPFGDYDRNSNIKLRQEFTKFVDENCEVFELKSGDFKESGTMVKTIIIKYIKGDN